MPTTQEWPDAILGLGAFMEEAALRTLRAIAYRPPERTVADTGSKIKPSSQTVCAFAWLYEADHGSGILASCTPSAG
jgi:hypothetical protein